jgi:rare lipoprotein A
MKRIILPLILIISLLFPSNLFAEGDLIFDDVPSDSFYYNAVKYLVDEDIVHGKNDGQFHPDDNITRVEALKIAFDLKEIILQKTLPVSQSFPDVSNDKWYSKYVFMAKKKQTMTGTEDGNFEPDRNITRAESCKIILGTYNLRLFQIHKSFTELHNYKDVEDDAWYSPCVGYISSYGLANFTGDYFNPDKYISRAEFADFIYNTHFFYKSGDIRPNRDKEEEDKEVTNSSNHSGDEIDILENNENNSGVSIPEDYQDQWNLLSKGIASYYHDMFNGRNTASGAKFDNSKMMAAHPLLPYNSKVRVKNIENGKTVDVEILDCGPFAKGRVIDLSKAAFEEIGHLGSGLLNVELELLELGPKYWQRTCFDLTQRRW